HHTEPRGFGMSLDRAPDVIDMGTGPNLLDPLPHRLARRFHEAACGLVGAADQERGVAVAVHAAEIDRDVTVDDVAFLQHAVIRAANSSGATAGTSAGASGA